MKRGVLIRIFLLGIPLCLGGLSCTDLTPKVYDRVATFWKTPEEIQAGVALPYAGLRDYTDAFGIYCLNEMSTDEIIVPTRGGDWYDNGTWGQTWKHTWTPTVGYIEECWQFIYGDANNSGIATLNSVIENVKTVDPKNANVPAILAEMKTLRAFYYYHALDLFGNVPILENNNTALSLLTNKPRAEVFAFVEKELKSNLAPLPTELSAITYGRVTQWFTQAVLAKLYLNAQVYTGTPRWTDCISACDAILNSGKYTLEPNFFYNFSISNEGSHENIFVIPYDINANLGYFLMQAFTLHYASGYTFGLDGGGANGFCTTAEYLNIFDPKDIRKKMFLVGQQYFNSRQYEDPIPDKANMQYDTDVGLPLNFDPVITTFSSADPKFRMAGARCAKWEFNKVGNGLMSNDFAVYRLADIILMKAEAQFRNGDAAGALTTINQSFNGVSIRSRAGMPDFSSAEMTLDGLLAERARELSWEGHRRNDLIRFGHYLDARIPEKAVSENFRTLFPIPKAELDKNHYLKQNPGY